MQLLPIRKMIQLSMCLGVQMHAIFISDFLQRVMYFDFAFQFSKTGDQRKECSLLKSCLLDVKETLHPGLSV